MENLSLKYRIIFCVILVIISPIQINGQICELSNEDEMAIKVSDVETKLKTFEKLLGNLDNFTLHNRHYIAEVEAKNEDTGKRLQMSDQFLQDLNNKVIQQQSDIEEIEEQLRHLNIHDLINNLQYQQFVVAEMRKQLKHLSSKAEPFLNKFHGNNCYWFSHHLYLGKKSHTQSGHSCQRWDSQAPHGHKYKKDHLFLDGSVSAAGNYCRDPDNTGKPWCYTIHRHTRWEVCDIPTCVT